MFETMEIGWLRLGQKSLDQPKVRRMTTYDNVHPITAMVERPHNPGGTLEIEIKGDLRLNMTKRHLGESLSLILTNH